MKFSANHIVILIKHDHLIGDEFVKRFLDTHVEVFLADNCEDEVLDETLSEVDRVSFLLSLHISLK